MVKTKSPKNKSGIELEVEPGLTWKEFYKLAWEWKIRQRIKGK